MSIEQSLEKIAMALETLVVLAERQAGTVTTDKPANAKTTKLAKPATADVIPGIEDVTPGADTGMQNIEAATIKTQQELRDFAQKYLAASGEKSTQLLKYIKEEVCKLNKKEPKLITMPTENIVKAAQMIYNYCFKNDIIVV